MSLRGSVDSFPLAQVLQLLASGSFSGQGTLERPSGRATLGLHEGRIRFATAAFRDRLGRALVRDGVISHSHLEEALARQRDTSPRVPLASILVGMGISAIRLEQATERHLVSTVSEILGWDDGRFEFVERSGASSLSVLGRGVAVNDLLLAHAAELQQQSPGRQVPAPSLFCELRLAESEAEIEARVEAEERSQDLRRRGLLLEVEGARVAAIATSSDPRARGFPSERHVASETAAELAIRVRDLKRRGFRTDLTA